MNRSKTLDIFTDGGARGNPGPAAVGIVVNNQNGQRLTAFGHFIGPATNNVAEYQAVITALDWLVKQPSLISNYQQINFYLDSNLVVNQLNGKFKIKNLNLKNLIIKIKALEKKISRKITYQFIPRTKNYQADFLVNQTLDKQS